MSKTEVIMVVDKSGSMASVRAATIDGLNSYVREQVEGEEDVDFTISLFDNRFYPVCTQLPAADVTLFDKTRYKASGGTALFDAIGRSVSDFRQRQEDSVEYNPDKVLFVIVTDGQEADSKEYSSAQIQGIIEDGRGEGWEFIFMGCDEAQIAQGRSLGVIPAGTIRYDKTNQGVRMGYTELSRSTMAYSQMGRLPDVPTDSVDPDSIAYFPDRKVDMSGTADGTDD